MVRRVPVLEVELRADIESEEYVSSASLYSTVRPYLPNFTVKSFGGSVGCSDGLGPQFMFPVSPRTSTTASAFP